MSLPGGSGASGVRAVIAVLAALGCHTTFSNGNPIYTPGNAFSPAPAGRR